MTPDNDYYEVLQISRNADVETIHRVYRIMAARFHPDNPRTGDTETFLLLRRAYQTLGDPEQRAKYDSTRLIEEEAPLPIFELKDFVHGLKGEVRLKSHTGDPQAIAGYKPLIASNGKTFSLKNVRPAPGGAM